MKITICGSMKFMDKMLEIKKQLEKRKHEINLPVWENLQKAKSFSEIELMKRKKEYILEHFRKIKKSDAILVLNYTKNMIENYIGGNSLIEIGIAFDQDKKIFILNSSLTLFMFYPQDGRAKKEGIGELNNLI